MTIDALAIGDDEFDFHEFAAVGPVLSDVFDGVAELDQTTDRDAVFDLDAYDVFVDYTTKADWTEDQLAELTAFVASGCGYVGIHCAIVVDSFVEKPCDELASMVGGRFVTHPEMTAFDVEIVDRTHPVTADVESFRTYDEPYHLDWDEDRVRVLAAFEHEAMGTMPAAWVRSKGDGRVFYCSLGHDAGALETDGVRRLLRNGLAWASGDQ
ncbi:ThuA domain-containing protein [Salinarchaeum laminariae]|uniref:ThuA domain-containing protein n=1 Tax=Salinarchaeum laminariae TaxID=869888 RepID=UPI0020BE63BA|nr:ThuA domain-containing protein [Salinarchaeum laminariae]